MRPVVACAILGMIPLVVGCDSGVEVDDIITAPLYIPSKGNLQDQHLVVPKGRALGFVAQPMGRDETLKQRITLASTDPSIAGIEKTVEMNQFVLIGVNVGKTELVVKDDSGRTASPKFQVEVIEP